jgi:PIN domain nuclease of toxin-antitoxin system
MKIILDSHVVWWFFKANEKLSDSSREIIKSASIPKHVSVATIWEVAIKISIGKLSFENGIHGFINAVNDNGFAILPIEPKHVGEAAVLPYIHRDPFDRMLIAQAIVENMHLMTSDADILKYNVKHI